MMRKTVLSAKIWHQIEVTNSQLIIGLWHKTFLIVTKKMLFTPKKTSSSQISMSFYLCIYLGGNNLITR